MNKPLILVVEDDSSVKKSDHNHTENTRLSVSGSRKRRNCHS